MAACTQCGSRSRSGADFCSSCGAASSGVRRGTASVEMLSDVSNTGRVQPAGGTESNAGGSAAANVSIETGSRGRRILGVGCVVLALAFGWSMISGGSDASEAAAERTQEDGSDRSEDVEDETESKTVPLLDADELDESEEREPEVPDRVTTRVVGGVEECVVVGAEQLGEDQTNENPSDDVPRSDFDAVEDTESHGCEIASEYQLLDSDGQVADASLVAELPSLIVVGDRNLDQINVGLGTAERMNLNVMSVMLRTQTHLVLRTADGVIAVRLDDLGGEPVVLSDSRDSDVSPGTDPSTAWIIDYVSGAEEFYQTDLDTGEVLETLDAEQLRVGADPFGSDIVNEIGSGAYEKTADGYRRFSDGWAVVASDEVVLIHRCDDARRCENVWLDRSNGFDLGYPEPELGQTFYWGWLLSDGGHWLQNMHENAGDLYEIRTGRVVELNVAGRQTFESEFQSTIQVSDDGGWAAYPDNFGTGVRIVDLRSEDVYRIETDTRVSQVFFSSPASEP